MALRPVTVALTLASVLLLGAALAAWQRREAPAANIFAVVTGVGGAGAVTVAASVALGLPRTVVLASTIIVSLLMPVPWLLFSFEYTGRTELVSLNVAGVTATLPWIGLLATALIFGSQLLPGMNLPSQAAASGLDAVVIAFLGMVQRLALLYAGGLMLVGSGILLWTFHRYEYLDSTTGMLLGIFGTIPWLSLLFGFQVASIEPLALPRTVAVGFLIGGVSVGSIFGRYHLFRNVPAAGNIGPTTIIEELEDMVIVTDDEGTAIEVNDAAKRILDTTEAEVVGADISGLLNVTLPDLQENDSVEVEARSGRKLLEPTVSELSDQHDRCLGYAIVLRDVTARTTRQQRLEVLNRVLRHNLGNDLNVVLGQAEWLERKIDNPELADTAEMIVGAADDLVRLSEEARELERLIDTTETATRDIPLAPMAEDVLEATAGHYQRATYDCDVPSGVVVEGSSDLLELALQNLVENAIEHNDSDDPHVGLTASYELGQAYPLTVTVADNGPGIPDNEQQAIMQGTETPLQHSSGLGLWAVRWAVTKLGGSIDIEHSEPRGTTVLLRFPRAHRADIGNSEIAADQ